jgi:hypothetical protein
MEDERVLRCAGRDRAPMAIGIPTLSPPGIPMCRGRAAYAMNEHGVGHPIWGGCIVNGVKYFRSLPT